MVSQRRNRRGSFQATPVRMRRGRPLLSPAFLVAVYRSHRGRGFERRRRPPRRIHFRARCYRGEVSACVGGTIHIHVHKSARGEKRRNGRHCSLSTCARETTDDGTILHFARYPPSGASVEQWAAYTCGFQRAMTQTQFKTESELKNRPFHFLGL